MPISFTHLTASLLVALLLAGCGGAGGDETPAASTAAASPPATSAGSTAVAAEGAGGPGEWFVTTGCVQCHSVSVYGVKAKGEIGPDLSIAADDVKSRFGVSLEEFFEAPSGTMAIVLSTQIQLTPDQKKVAIAKLHEAYDAYQKQQAATR